MKITKSHLKQIIKEELQRLTEETHHVVKIGDKTYNVKIDGGEIFSVTHMGNEVQKTPEFLKQIKTAIQSQPQQTFRQPG